MDNRIALEAAHHIELHRSILVEQVVDDFYRTHAERCAVWGETGRVKTRQDVDYHFQHLMEAVRTGEPRLFGDYIEWTRIVLQNYGIEETLLIDCLRVMSKAVMEGLPLEGSVVVAECFIAGLAQLTGSAIEPASFMHDDDPLADLAAHYLATALKGDRVESSALIARAVERGADVADIYVHVFEKVQHEIGRLWQTGRITIADEHSVTATSQMVLSQLYPRIARGFKHGHTMIAACIPGEAHEIGLRIVTDFFELDGWDTIYLGANVPLENIVETTVARRADLLAISATLVTNVHVVANLVDMVRLRPECRHTKILAGGRPFNVAPGLWRKIGVDGSAPDAGTAARVADRLAGVRV